MAVNFARLPESLGGLKNHLKSPCFSGPTSTHPQDRGHHPEATMARALMLALGFVRIAVVSFAAGAARRHANFSEILHRRHDRAGIC
jgi:hypothetical protein